MNGRDASDSSFYLGRNLDDDHLEVWAYKTRSAVKGDRLLGVVASSAGQLLQRAGFEEWPLRMGSSEVGTLTLRVTGFHMEGSPAATTILEEVSTRIGAAAATRFPKLLLESGNVAKVRIWAQAVLKHE